MHTHSQAYHFICTMGMQNAMGISWTSNATITTYGLSFVLKFYRNYLYSAQLYSNDGESQKLVSSYNESTYFRGGCPKSAASLVSWLLFSWEILLYYQMYLHIILNAKHTIREIIAPVTGKNFKLCIVFPSSYGF